MSVLGKILIVLNLLVAGAFAYVATENWKTRQDLTFADFRNTVQIKGLPVAPPEGVKDVGADRVPFVFEINANTNLDSLSKETLGKLIPRGDQEFGGEAVADQTAEVKRVHDKVKALVVAAKPEEKLGVLRTYLLNLTRSGTERDGVIAVFDMKESSRSAFARADLPYVARTSSQVSALKTLVDIGGLGDPAAIVPADSQASRIKGARDSVSRLVLGEVSHGAGTGGADAVRKLSDAAIDVLKPGANDSTKQALVAAATADADGFKHLADLAVNPLKTRADVEAAVNSIRDFVTGKTMTAAEKAALTEIVGMIASNSAMTSQEIIEKAATALLDQKFDEAEAPAAAGKTANASGVTPEGEKARRIAHVLYHIDAHRTYDANAKEARNQWHTRVSMIVGLKEYVMAAEIQASEYSEAANRLLSVITEEQSAFEAEYLTRVQRAVFLNSQLVSVEAQLKQQVTITGENDRLYKERVTERDDLKTKLEMAQQGAATALDRLKEAQTRLFKIQKDLRDAQQALLTIEKQLRQLELGSGSGL
jgi:hypothetical protein